MTTASWIAVLVAIAGVVGAAWWTLRDPSEDRGTSAPRRVYTPTPGVTAVIAPGGASALAPASVPGASATPQAAQEVRDMWTRAVSTAAWNDVPAWYGWGT